MLRYQNIDMACTDMLNLSKMDYGQYYVKVQMVKQRVHFSFINFLDLELSFWFKLKYPKSV